MNKLLVKSKIDSDDEDTIPGNNSSTTTRTTTITTTATDAPKPEPEPEFSNFEEKLLHDLLFNKRRNKKARPVKKWTEPVTVNIGMALIHLDLDEQKSVLEIDAWMRFNWQDEFLIWDPEKYAGVEQVHLNTWDLWKPDIHLYNNADGANMNHYGDVYYIVYNTGKVLWVPPAKFKAFCKVDLRLWPHEKHICKLKFGSWTGHGGQIQLGLYDNQDTVEHLQYYTDNKEWQLGPTSVTKNKNTYPGIEEHYPDITFTFHLQRSSPSYRAGVILPCLVTMLLVLASFLLPPSAGDKLIVNTVCFIVCVLYLLHFQSSLPAMSDHIPLIVLFYSNTTALVGIAIVLNICCISLTREKRFSSPPKWLRNFFSGFMGRILCLGNYYHQVSDTHQRLVVELDDVQESPESEQTERDLSAHGQAGAGIMKDWLLVAAGIERFCFFVYTMAFALVTSVYI